MVKASGLDLPFCYAIISKLAYGICLRFFFLCFCLNEMEAQDSSTDNSQTPVECLTRDDLLPEVTSVAADWLEMEVAAGFRIWQLMFLALAGLICLVVFLCCCMKCRIPRTKQEIEADFLRKKLCKRFRTHLNKLSLEDDTNFKGALDKVKNLCENEPSPSAKKSKKKDKEQLEGGEDLTGSQSALVAKPKLTLMEKLRKLLSPAQRESQEEENPEGIMVESDIIVKVTDTGSTDSSNSQEPISIVGITVELARDEDDDDDEKDTKEESNSAETKSSSETETDPSEDSFQKSRT